MQNEQINYRTHQIVIKQGHRLYDYFQHHAMNAKNVYNVTNFYYRQVMTAMKSNKPLQPLQQQVLNEIQNAIEPMNEIQRIAHQKKVEKELVKPESERKTVKLTVFEEPSIEKPYVTYRFLDALFKHLKQVDYRSLPTQTAQAIMQLVFQDWKSFFEAKKDYKTHPEKYNGEPKIPNYKKKHALKEVVYSNQDAVVSSCGKYLKLPLTKTKLNIGKIGSKGALKQVRIIPKADVFVLELVMEIEQHKPLQVDNERYLSIDLGIDNLATLVANTGMRPVLIKGGHIKSINQYYNQQLAHYKGVLRQGMAPKEGMHTSKRIERLHQKRHAKIKDLFHKASYHIVQIAVRENVSKVVVGKNNGWKQDIDMSKQSNQKFCFVPHNMLIAQLRYKLAQVGIELVEQEESYTSKASFLSMDDIPVYDPTFVGEHEFSGYRKSRGLYKIKGEPTIINADVNGSANILRKAFPNAFSSALEESAETCLRISNGDARARANGIEGLPNQLDSLKLKGIVSTPQSLIVR